MSRQWHWEPTVGYFPGMHVADAMADVAEDSERVVRAACQQCAVREQVTVPADRHDKYLQGGLIQEVFPEYSAQQREVLMNALPPWRVDRPFSYFLCTDCWHDMGAE